MGAKIKISGFHCWNAIVGNKKNRMSQSLFRWFCQKENILNERKILFSAILEKTCDCNQKLLLRMKLSQKIKFRKKNINSRLNWKFECKTIFAFYSYRANIQKVNTERALKYFFDQFKLHESNFFENFQVILNVV